MNNKFFALLGLVLSTTGLLIIAPPAAQAQAPAAAPDTESDTSGLAEIVVTAQRRQEKMVDVPISITAIGAEQMATANVQNLADIAQLTPSLRFDSQTEFYQPSIRGIGTGITTSGGGSNVGIYIDGLDWSRELDSGDTK